MKKKIYIVGIIFIAILATILFPKVAYESTEENFAYAEQTVVIEEKVIKKIEDPTQYLQNLSREEWLEKLVSCESGGNPNAINLVDLDGTSSHGILQFKDTTFEMYKLRYGLGDVELYDPIAQKTIVRLMMDDSKVRWQNEFPDCVRKYGFPPTN